MLPAALTWRFQCIDVAIAAKVKGYLYELWSNWMAQTIINKKYREKSWNYIALRKHDLINWCLEAWKKVQTKRRLLQTGCLATYMTLDLDSAMAKFDNYEQLPVGEEDDFNRHDWKEEIKNMDKVDHYNLWISPLNWVVDLETKEKKKWI